MKLFRNLNIYVAIIFAGVSGFAQSKSRTATLPDAPIAYFGATDSSQTPSPAPQTANNPNSTNTTQTAPRQLTIKDAEALALKNNPAISVARLNSLASHQVTREARSNLWPSSYVNLTGVDSQDNSRITAGGLNNPIIFPRAAVGTTINQLITDFGHTTNLVASARLHEQAEDQNSAATKEQILLAVDNAFYAGLQASAVLKVADQTVASRQLLSDQVSALTKSKLKSDLDLSFANVNLAQAKLLQLDAQNNYQSTLANLSALLGFNSLQNFELIDETQALAGPPPTVNDLINDAFQNRPEILALQFESQSTQKFHAAQHDSLFPSINAMGAVGVAPVRSDSLANWYGAVGINIQIPVFEGFLYTARSHETDLRAQAVNQQLIDLRNRISRDVRTSWLNANTAYQRMDVSRQLLDQANLALNLAQTRYKLGLSSIVELSQAQLQQTQAEISSATANYEYQLALADLKYQTTGI
jgi:outer membrane protein